MWVCARDLNDACADPANLDGREQIVDGKGHVGDQGHGLDRFPALVTELGGDPCPLLSRAGINGADVGRFDAFLTYLSLINVVESAAAATRTPPGRRLGERHRASDPGAGRGGRAPGARVADAFTIFEQYLAAYSTAITVTITTEGESAFVEFKVVIKHPPAHPQTVELSLTVMLRVLRFLFGAGYTPTSVHLPHQPLSPRQDYVRDFSCTPRFGSPRAGFVIPPPT